MSYPNALDSFVAKINNFDDVMAADINELQTSIMASQAYFGTQIQFGWLPLPTCTYVSPTSFTLPGNLTSFLQIGTKFRCENGTRKYGYVLSSFYTLGTGRTTVNLVPNTSYALAAGGITEAYISYANPPDFPDWLSWAPTLTGFSVVPENSVYYFKIEGKQVFFNINQKTDGTSNATTFTISLPVTAVSGTTWQGANGYAVNNSVGLTVASKWYIPSGGTAIQLYTNMATGTWTASGGKRALFQGFYWIS